jgi:transcriptional regulator of heat shock response
MNTRQQNILRAIIKEYQKTGEPVASQILVQKYAFNLSPATIRAEMLLLDKQGLLEQPHHSAGRVPTTKAYRQFVDEILDEKEIRIKDGSQIKRKISQFDGNRIFPAQLAQVLADFSHNLGISGSLDNFLDFHEAGLSSLLEEEEFCQPQGVAEILKGFDRLEKEFAQLFDEVDENVEVFVGEENPINDFYKCSFVVSVYESGRGNGFVGILGPKRMDYERNIFLVGEIKKLIENFQ